LPLSLWLLFCCSGIETPYCVKGPMLVGLQHRDAGTVLSCGSRLPIRTLVVCFPGCLRFLLSTPLSTSFYLFLRLSSGSLTAPAIVRSMLVAVLLAVDQFLIDTPVVPSTPAVMAHCRSLLVICFSGCIPAHLLVPALLRSKFVASLSRVPHKFNVASLYCRDSHGGIHLFLHHSCNRCLVVFLLFCATHLLSLL
jgi:hypothetical protein